MPIVTTLQLSILVTLPGLGDTRVHNRATHPVREPCASQPGAHQSTKGEANVKNIFYPTVFMGVALLMLAMLMVPRALASPPEVTFSVDTQLDLIDADTTDGTCLASSCSLRAAIMQANTLTGLGVTIVEIGRAHV